MKKLLLISAIPPFPRQSGGATRIYHTILELSKKYSIYFITFNSAKNEFYQQYTTQFINLDLKPKSLLSRLPYRFSDWDNPKLKTLIPQIIKDNGIKLVQVEFSQLLYLADYIPKNVTKIFTAHDISAVSFWRRIPESITWLKKLASLLFWLQIWLYEKKYLKRYNQIYTVSAKDQRYLQRIYELSSTVVPNGIEAIDFISTHKTKILRLGFIGSISHPPNLYALNYFLEKISPLLDKNNLDYKFYLAGHNPDIANSKIVNLGVVDDVKNFYQQIDILVAPIFSGSGTRIKILEALSYGIPVLTTTIGAEGIDIRSSYLQIANTPAHFAKMISNFPELKAKDSTELKAQLQHLLWSNIFKN